MLRVPLIRNAFAAVARPFPIAVRVQIVGKIANVGLDTVRIVEALARVQRAEEKKRRVRSRQFAEPRSQAGVGVQPVIEESFVTGVAVRAGALRSILEPPQRRSGALGCGLARDPSARETDAVGRQGEADRSDADLRLQWPSIGSKPGRWIRRFPEVQKDAAFQILEHGTRQLNA